MSYFCHGLLMSARLPLAPTLLTNAMAAWVAINGGIPEGGGWGAFFLVVMTGLCFFLAGMWGNDWADAKWDAEHRPDKPVSQGLVSVNTLEALSISAGLLGLLLCSVQLFGPSSDPSTILVYVLPLLICLYNWLHKMFFMSVIIMGLCRGWWAITAGILAFHAKHPNEALSLFSSASKYLLPYSLSLCVFTVFISWIAKGEYKSEGRKKWVGILLSSMCLHDMVWLVAFLMSWEMAVFAFLCYAASIGLKRMGHSPT